MNDVQNVRLLCPIKSVWLLQIYTKSTGLLWVDMRYTSCVVHRCYIITIELKQIIQ